MIKLQTNLCKFRQKFVYLSKLSSGNLYTLTKIIIKKSPLSRRKWGLSKSILFYVLNTFIHESNPTAWNLAPILFIGYLFDL